MTARRGWLSLSLLLLLLLLGGVATANPDPATNRQLEQGQALLPLLKRLHNLLDTGRAATNGEAATAGQNRVAAVIEERLADGEELLLELRLGHQPLAEAVFARWQGGSLRLPLDELVVALDFPITVDSEQGRASGWFIDQQSTFELDLAAGQLLIAGEKRPIPASVAIEDGVLTIGEGEVADWFGIDMAFDQERLVVALNSSRPLPLQARARRERQIESLRRQRVGAAVLPRHDRGPPLIDLPLLDLNLGSRYQAGEFAHYYQLNAAAPLLGGRMEGSLTGSRADPLSAARARLVYEEPDGLRGLPARHLAIGDVRSVSNPVLPSGRLEQGVVFGSQIESAAGHYGTTLIEGDAPPGYEVELYRDELLLDYQLVDESGHYLFESVPLNGQEGFYTLRLYGPQGQREELSRRVVAREGWRLPFDYRISLTQQGRRLFDSSTSDGGIRVGVAADTAISDWLSLSASYEGFDEEGERRHLFGIGPQLSGSGWSGGLNLLTGAGGQPGFAAQMQTRLGEQTLRLRHLERATDESGEPVGSQLLRTTALGLGGRLQSPLGQIHYTLEYDREEEQSGGIEREIELRLANRIGPMQLNSGLRHWWSSGSSGGSTLFGNQRLGLAIGRYSGWLRADYRIRPDYHLDQLKGGVTWPRIGQLRPGLELSHDMASNESRLGLSLPYDHQQMTITPTLSYDRHGGLSGMLSLRMGVGYDHESGKLHVDRRPISQQGMVVVQLFEDLDGDLRRSPGEPAVADGLIQARQLRRQFTTDRNGLAVVTGLAPYQATDLALVPGSLAESALQPATEGVSVVGQRGQIQRVELPLVRVWTVRGTAYLRGSSGEIAPDAAAVVEAIPATGGETRRVISDGEGRYEFSGLTAGNYRIRTSREDGMATLERSLRTINEIESYDAIDLVSAPTTSALLLPPLTGEHSSRSSGLEPLSPGARANRPATAARPVTGRQIAVSLGHFRSRLGMVLAHYRLRRRFPQEIRTLRPVGGSADERSSGHPLDLGPFSERMPAEKLCDRLRGAGESCQVSLVEVRPQSGRFDREVAGVNQP